MVEEKQGENNTYPVKDLKDTTEDTTVGNIKLYRRNIKMCRFNGPTERTYTKSKQDKFHKINTTNRDITLFK